MCCGRGSYRRYFFTRVSSYLDGARLGGRFNGVFRNDNTHQGVGYQ